MKEGVASFLVLAETAAGYALLEVVEFDEIASMGPEMQRALSEASNFLRCVKLKAFLAFSSAEMALENINEISEHGVPERLHRFLEMNLPQNKKKKKLILGVVEPDLGKAISEATGASVRSDDIIREILRGARQHLVKLIPELGNGVIEQSQLGLGHAFSRAKVKFNPARADNMIIQSIGLLDTLDKDINTFAMRCREWYSWHFPELRDLVRDNYAFARAAAVVGDRASFLAADETAKMKELADAVSNTIEGDDGVKTATAIRSAARMSMGMDCSSGDMANIMRFTRRMVALATYRAQLGLYLGDKMLAVAPNLATLVGESVGARLISKAGSLSSLAKCPASTVQILGAEKALFRALKKKGNTPKYGLIYHSTFIGRAAKKNKGRISRYLANKCAIASRIDAFAEDVTTKYGEQMREQVEERLRFFDTGETPRKNIDVMTQVANELKAAAAAATKKENSSMDVVDKPPPSSSKKKSKKKKEQEEEVVELADSSKKKKKKKKDDEENDEPPKKKKKATDEPATPAALASPAAGAAEDASSKKKKKKRKKDDA
ncbi:hypothetical protein CTAYLR_006093 [Chrysophaeum taylorii]|uniref:Nucleolar protein 56 n=1 Tax=Chrysophaeum taylorii TaxID=2483200 RepID=A0AAD7UB69_9STRA|nr:hypothetical protein CTAYLR_006093 [Chrysophaeum taylorii]